MRKANIWIWLLGGLITLMAMTYQKMTGPTQPFRKNIVINDESYRIRLSPSEETILDDVSKPYIFVMNVDAPGTVATISYRQYPTNNDFKTDTLKFINGRYEAYLPQLPAAGKYEYEMQITDGKKSYDIPHQLMRFKDPVPWGWLGPHIFFMFLAFFFANVAGIMALFNRGNFVRFTVVTSVCFAVGGLFLGPVVQKYAFGDFWTGVPFGWDLTDNKTVIAAIFWGIALYMNHKKSNRLATITASVVMLLIYAIPHSMFGSQLNPETGEVVQGMVINQLMLIGL